MRRPPTTGSCKFWSTWGQSFTSPELPAPSPELPVSPTPAGVKNTTSVLTTIPSPPSPPLSAPSSSVYSVANVARTFGWVRAAQAKRPCGRACFSANRFFSPRDVPEGHPRAPSACTRAAASAMAFTWALSTASLSTKSRRSSSNKFSSSFNSSQFKMPVTIATPCVSRTSLSCDPFSRTQAKGTVISVAYSADITGQSHVSGNER
mmetsp:Transcript_44874/g.65591  ORF Transcript_44874/g.65591 Transcript_44874/m.65591 type:complete len:206 (+) Transcript_44874:364-981(+)